MDAKTYISKLTAKLDKCSDVGYSIHALKYEAGEFPFIRCVSKDISKNDRVIMLRAGIHGDEISGPITVLEYFDEIAEWVREAGLKLLLYPLGNPSGFEKGTRYNVDGDKGDAGNNDFLRYVLADGSIADDIGAKNEFSKWRWSSEPELNVKLPLETKLMHELLRKDPLDQVVAMLDLHQDYITSAVGPAAYHYVLGNVHKLTPIAKRVEYILPLLGNSSIHAGLTTPMKSDENGFIVRHDGTLPDLLYRIGAKYCVTPETTGITPLGTACRVNLEWISGVIDLLKEERG